MQTDQVLILGGGLAGLACARHLEQFGMAWHLVEASDAVGGRVRTDRVDGFLLDRGFQVFLDSYPEARDILDLESLDLQPFLPGALIRYRGKLRRLSDPWRAPMSTLATALNPAASLTDKLLIGKLRREVQQGSVSEQLGKQNGSTIDFLKAYGFSQRSIESFWRPFLGGIFLDRQLLTSSRMFRFVFRMMSQGLACLPARGMQSVPENLASKLPRGRIRLNSPVSSVSAGEIVLASGERLTGRAVVLAGDAVAASKLLDGFNVVGSQSVSCLYFAASAPPVHTPMLVLNGEQQGPINNLCVPSAIASGYAPAGQCLISVSVLEQCADSAALQTAVVGQLRDWFGPMVDQWQHLRTYTIEHALPAQPPAALEPPSRPVRWQSGVYVCGDHRENASINGALVSGRLAAEAVIDDLRRGQFSDIHR